MANTPMVRLNKYQIDKKIGFLKNYILDQNAATGSVLDANANVTHKNIATLSAEIHKDFDIQVNRALLYNRITTMYGEDLAVEYIRQLEHHEIYCHDETSLYPYCVSLSMYQFHKSGMVSLGGESKAPKHLDSFCGSFINFIFAVASQFAGAVATVEFLMCFDYFAKKDYGDDYLKTHEKEINSALQHVVYSLNQPSAARGFQSVFWNISLFDRYYFEGLFSDFVFPLDFKKPSYDSLSKLQCYFMSWFNKERETSILTFPVITAAQLITEEKECKDAGFADFLAEELSKGNSFFMYQSDSVDSLASCCRLKNEIRDKPTFSYSLGAGGVSTGSVNVITLNINRLVQDGRDLATEISKIHKYQMAYRENIKHFQNNKMLPVYDAGFINLDDQFLTIGISGIVEAAEFKGLTIGTNKAYQEFGVSILKTIYDLNRSCEKVTGLKFNTELVPGENLGVKFANWDQVDGYVVPRDCYNSYFYLVEDSSIGIEDKFVLQGQAFAKYLDGGSALHLNLLQHPNKKGYLSLMKLAAVTGCNYWTTNVLTTCCENPECRYINKQLMDECIKCGSKEVSHATRVIGYLKKVDNFSNARQIEHGGRFYH